MSEVVSAMNDAQPSTHPILSRRRALAGLGAGAIGAALSTSLLRARAQDSGADSIQSEDEVVYGEVDGTPLLMMIVRPADRPEPRPAVILIHGGGLIQGTRWDHSEAATALAMAGYVTFSPDYRLFVEGDPSTQWPAQLDDVQRAVRWVRANAATYGVDPNRVGAFGFSSGGQLAAFLGTRDTRNNSDASLAFFSSKVDCVVTMGGLFDFTFPNAHPYAEELDAQILGGSAESPPPASAYEDFSPISFVDSTSAPFLILQEGNPDIIPFEQPQRMVAALESAGVEVTYIEFPELTHDSWFNWAPEADATLEFFQRHLTPEV
jgi:acetyl esterase/lipase